ncbi:hypothetical protein Clacol_005873 [Clathrus columnatus]|uniref:Nudix hydrolase domain-containing protein n=1 Tax=Clathrus columnatus TaxID=1419009 RepID=A0AAV5ADF0_9AGAM|nr:hypothetical protein Clacol_005873 [Clathrus columnatus]
MVLIYDRQEGYWCLPKGRKDLGESLESTVIREAYEETGYRAKFFPIAIPNLAPSPDPPKKANLNCEPIYITTQVCESKRNGALEYTTFWYVLYIEADAIPGEETGMESEKGYEPQLVDFSAAVEKLSGTQQAIVCNFNFGSALSSVVGNMVSAARIAENGLLMEYSPDHDVTLIFSRTIKLTPGDLAFK